MKSTDATPVTDSEKTRSYVNVVAVVGVAWVELNAEIVGAVTSGAGAPTPDRPVIENGVV